MSKLWVSRINNRPLRRLAIVVSFPQAVLAIFLIGAYTVASLAWKRMVESYGAEWRRP